MASARVATHLDLRRLAARAFVRSLNLLLKSARLYGVDHGRTASQLDVAWEELQAALPAKGELTIGAAGEDLILDGNALEGSASERAFARFLSGAGLTSLQFSSATTREDFLSLVQSFAGSNRANALVAALERSANIRVNRLRYVADDPGDGRIAAELMARALGQDAERLRSWLENPQKLLQLIAAAEGAEQHAGTGQPPDEDQVVAALRLLGQLGRAGEELHDPEQARELADSIEHQVSSLTPDVTTLLERALRSLSEGQEPQGPMLLELAEHLAIHYALERYQRGETSVNAVRELLNRMSREVENLRKVLSVHEEKMTRAGLEVESYADILDRQFWASVPESGKRSVLLSPEAWCVPPRNIRQFLETLQERTQEDAKAILQNYVTCLHQPDEDARRKAAVGVIELASFYSTLGGDLLEEALAHVAQQLATEPVAEIQSLLSSAFARLSQEAAARHQYGAIRQTMNFLEEMQRQQPVLSEGLQSRVGVKSRLREFIEEAVQADPVPGELIEVLRYMAQPAADYLSEVFEGRSRRVERDRVVGLAQAIGARVSERLCQRLETEAPGTAIPTIGLLSRLAPEAVAERIRLRLDRWNRAYHDWVVRALAASGAQERGQLLVALLEDFDPLVLSSVIDEIGMSGDPQCGPPLMRLAGGELSLSSEPYFRLKAVEALGRLRERPAAPVLRKLVESKGVWRWTEPSEIRIAAAQSLLKIDPEWARRFLPQSGLTPEELTMAPLDPDPAVPWTRQRRYPRVHLARAVPAVATTVRGEWALDTQVLSLGGGLAEGQSVSPPGTELELKLKGSSSSVQATAVVRDTQTQQMGFEIVHIDLAERVKLRKLLLTVQPAAA